MRFCSSEIFISGYQYIMNKSDYLNRLICNPWKGLEKDSSAGLERQVRRISIILRCLSVQFLLVACCPEDDKTKHARRNVLVDRLVVAQCILTILLWGLTPPEMLRGASIVVAYLLFCLFLSLLNIVLFSNVPSISQGTTSVTRSLILLFVNVVQVTFSFAVFYRYAFNLKPNEAIYGAFLVLGTVGLPNVVGSNFLIPLHITANILLLGFIVAIYIGRVPLGFYNKHKKNIKHR
jgi:hypothetical protein